MTLPKQRKDEPDADYAVRLEEAKKRNSERDRKKYEANREAFLARAKEYRKTRKEVVKETQRRYREKHREDIKRRDRERYEAKVLADAKGRPLKNNYRRRPRPAILSRLIIKVAEDFCRNYGFSLERKLDADILRHAAETVLNSPELYGAANPWYGTDFLCPALVKGPDWPYDFKKKWRNKA